MERSIATCTTLTKNTDWTRCSPIPHGRTTRQLADYPQRHCASQMAALSAATGKAFTTVFAALAFTFTSFPNITLFPAFVAAFLLVLTMHTPGITNFPALFTCFVATSARTSMTFEHSDFFRPDPSASASAMAPLVMLLAAFI